jgi:hypothetical protein
MKTGIESSGKKNLSCITFLLAFYVLLTTSFTSNPENFMWKSQGTQNSVTEFNSNLTSSTHTSNDIAAITSENEDGFFISAANKLEQKLFGLNSF